MALTQTQAPSAVGAAHRTFSVIDWIAMVLLIIGGINWGLVGLAQFDLVAALFGADSPLSRIIYILVGLSALYSIYTALKVNSRIGRG